MEKSRFESPYQNKMLEIKATDDLQSSRLNSIESLDKTQNERLNKIEALNELQSTHLTQHDEALSKQAADLSSTAEAIRQEENERAAAQQELDEAQTAALNAAKDAQAAKDQEQDTAFEAYKKAQEEIDSVQNAAIEKAEEWQDENWKDEDGKELSLQEYISKMVAKELEDIGKVNSTIDTKEKALAARLKTAEDTLKETKEKNAQLEGLLRLYAKNNSTAPTASNFKVENRPVTDNIAYVLDKGESVKASVNFTDDANWFMPAYAKVILNEEETDNFSINESIITWQAAEITNDTDLYYKNALTEKISDTKSIQFVKVKLPNTVVDTSKLTKPEGDGKLNWTSVENAIIKDATERTDIGFTYTKGFEFLKAGSTEWDSYTIGDNLENLFPSGADDTTKVQLQYNWEVEDNFGHNEPVLVDLGSYKKGDFGKWYTTYSLGSEMALGKSKYTVPSTGFGATNVTSVTDLFVENDSFNIQISSTPYAVYIKEGHLYLGNNQFNFPDKISDSDTEVVFTASANTEDTFKGTTIKFTINSNAMFSFYGVK